MATLEDIRREVEKQYGVDITAQTRKHPIPDALKVFCRLSRIYTAKSLQSIGEFLDKDHSTVLWHYNQSAGLLESCKTFEKMYYKIDSKFNGSNYGEVRTDYRNSGGHVRSCIDVVEEELAYHRKRVASLLYRRKQLQRINNLTRC